MPVKPHIKLNTKQQKEQPIKLKFNYVFGDDDEQANEGIRNYYPMALAFRGYLNRFDIDNRNRINQRNLNLDIPLHIEYIQILFQSQFVVSTFYSQWFNEFGLLGVHFSQFNNEILFAIMDREKFSVFLREVNNFINKETGESTNITYSSKVIFIKEFRLLTTPDIVQFRQLNGLLNMKLIDDLPLGKNNFQSILASLEKYFQEREIQYTFSEESLNIELTNVTDNQITEIVQNFDIVLNVTSALATVISPSALNLPQRSYGFDVTLLDDTLPIIGIIDTGISNQTPLAPLIIPDETFNITASSVLIDEANHGTAVAALAALGKKAYSLGYRGEIPADAKLLSIKVMDANSASLSIKAVLSLLKDAKQKYPKLKVFVLTICYADHKRDNEDYSAYAFLLDKFSHENDCLIVISSANNHDAAVANNNYNLNYFLTEATNICTPAESMNNITVGAAAGSLRDGNFEGVAISKEFPALYSRKSHIDLFSLFPKNKINKHHFKPDIIEFGGDYEFGRSNSYIGQGLKASMEVLSANPAESFCNEIGTSFSAPLVANIAVQIQRVYPEIKTQSIKALIVNGASLNLIRFQQPFVKLLNKTSGHGLTCERKSIFSDENSVTFLIEEEIEPEQLKIFPLHFPKYLVEDNLGKKNGILKVTATLCFSFMPIINNQLGYCPMHIAFCFFKNQTGSDIQASDEEVKSLLRSSLRWSQSGRHVSKPIPYTNTQKINFSVNVQDLVNESGTFKLAINCRINPQLLPGTEQAYKKTHAFSLAITVEERLTEKKLTGKLYDEMVLCNVIENITAINLDTEGIVEAEA